jgi:hypothetical protein
LAWPDRIELNKITDYTPQGGEGRTSRLRHFARAS